MLIWRTDLPLEFSQLLNETLVWVDDPPPALHHVECTLEGVALVLHQVGQHQRYRSRHPGQTVHHEVGPLKAVVDEVGSLVEELANVAGLVVIDGDVEEVGDVGP